MARLVPLLVQRTLGEPCASSGLALAQGRFAGHGMIVGSDGNDGDLMLSAHEYKDDTAAALS
jgi:hypothetical protein